MQQQNRVNLTGLGASTSAVSSTSSAQSSNVTKVLLCVAAAATAVAGFAWYRRRTQSADGDDATAQMFDQPITVSGNPTGATVTTSAPFSSSAMATASGAAAPRTAPSNKGPQQRYHDAAAMFAAQTAPAALTSDECQSAIDAIVGLLPQYGGSVPRHLRPGYKSKKDKRKEKEEASKKERDGASKSAVVVKDDDDEFETDSSDGNDSYTTQLSLEMDIADSMIENFQEELIELSGIAEQEQGYLATGTKPPAAFRSLVKREFGGATATLRWLEHSLEYFEIVKERNALAVRLAEDEAKMTVEELLARQDARIKRRQQMLDEEEGGQDGGREEADAVLDFGGKPDGRGIQYQSTPVTRAMQYGDLAEDDDDDDAAEDGVLEMKSRGAHSSRKAVAAASGGRSQEQQEAMEDLLRMMGVDRRAMMEMKNSRDGGYTVGGGGDGYHEDDDVEDWEDDEDDDFDEDAHMRMMMAGSGPYDEDRDYYGAGMYDGEDYGDDPNFYFRDDDDEDEEQDEDERAFLQAQFNEMLLKSVLMLHGRHFGKSSTTAAEEEEEESNASESSSENVNATKKDASSNKKKAGAGGKKQAKKTKSKKAATTKKSGKGAQQDEWVDY